MCELRLQKMVSLHQQYPLSLGLCYLQQSRSPSYRDTLADPNVVAMHLYQCLTLSSNDGYQFVPIDLTRTLAHHYQRSLQNPVHLLTLHFEIEHNSQQLQPKDVRNCVRQMLQGAEDLTHCYWLYR